MHSVERQNDVNINRETKVERVYLFTRRGTKSLLNVIIILRKIAIVYKVSSYVEYMGNSLQNIFQIFVIKVLNINVTNTL